jgi:hypothetical protein
VASKTVRKARSKAPAVGAIVVGGIFLTSAVMNVKISTIIRDLVSGDLSFATGSSSGGSATTATPATTVRTPTGKVPKGLPKIITGPDLNIPPAAKTGPLKDPTAGRPPIVAPPPTASPNRLVARHSMLKQAVSG